MTDTHTLRTVDTLIWIAQDEAVRHINFVVVVVARLTIMEAAISQAMLDTVLLQIALTSGGTGTLQTKNPFPFCLLLHIALLHPTEITFSILLLEPLHLSFRI